jgi:hypothetical protein
LDTTAGQQSINKLYEVPTSTYLQQHLTASKTREPGTINNVYELPSISQAIRYLHGAAGYPTKSTWLKAIRKGNYET